MYFNDAYFQNSMHPPRTANDPAANAYPAQHITYPTHTLTQPNLNLNPLASPPWTPTPNPNPNPNPSPNLSSAHLSLAAAANYAHSTNSTSSSSNSSTAYAPRSTPRGNRFRMKSKNKWHSNASHSHSHSHSSAAKRARPKGGTAQGQGQGASQSVHEHHREYPWHTPPRFQRLREQQRREKLRRSRVVVAEEEPSTIEFGPLYLRNFAVPAPPMRNPPAPPPPIATDSRFECESHFEFESQFESQSMAKASRFGFLSLPSTLSSSSALFGGAVTAEEAPRLHVSMAAMFPTAAEEEAMAMGKAKAKGFSPLQSEESAESPPIMLSLSSLY